MASSVLVTGGSGFIGAHTAAALIRSGREVRLTLSRALALIDGGARRILPELGRSAHVRLFDDHGCSRMEPSFRSPSHPRLRPQPHGAWSREAVIQLGSSVGSSIILHR
ncbi:MAG: NAD-dependent epimerase/dehydratase family protein [Myxococcota bacterium]